MSFVACQFALRSSICECNAEVYMKYTYMRFINILKCKIVPAFLIFHKNRAKILVTHLALKGTCTLLANQMLSRMRICLSNTAYHQRTIIVPGETY